MTDESYSFSTAKTRLDEIVTQVRKKDTSLEKSLDLLEEGVRLANVCTELIDHADWASAPGTPGGPAIATEQSTDGKAREADTEGSETVESAEPAESAESADKAAEQDADASADADTEADELEDADADTGNESEGREAADEVGEVWSEDEAWADETDDDPSDGDDGHGV